MSIADLYTSTCTTQRLSHVEDNYGGNTSTWAANLISYKCRIYKPSGSMKIDDIGKVEGVIFCAIGENTDVLLGDKIIDGTDEYIVKRVYGTYAKASIHHLELVLDKIT